MLKVRKFKIAIKMVTVILLGYLILLLAFQVCQGPEGNYTLGDGYYLNRWPGRLSGWEARDPTNPDTFKSALPERVTAYCIQNPWVIGKTEADQWFLMQKEQHEIYYPLATQEEAEKIAGFNIEKSDLVTDPISFWFPRHEYVGPGTKHCIAVVAVIYLAIVFIIDTILRLKNNRRMLKNKEYG